MVLNYIYVNGTHFSTFVGLKKYILDLYHNLIDGEIMYSADVSELISMNKKQLIEDGLSNALIDLLILCGLYFLIGVFSFILFYIFLYIGLPSPYIIAPRKYSIKQKTIYFGNKKINVVNLKIVVHNKKNYISLKKRWYKEAIRLYSEDIKALENVLKNNSY